MKTRARNRTRRIGGYVCLLLAPQLAESQEAGGTLTLSPTTIQFGSQVVGSTSKALKATLTNNGTTSVSNVAISITGDFAQTNSCTGSLAANASCSINVSFSPTASGQRSGTLTVTSSTGIPLTSALGGIGYSLVSISVTPANPWIAAQTTVALQATGSYDDGSTRNITSSVHWTSSATNIATVDGFGNVTGVAPGPATITATSGSIAGSTNVTVTSATLTSIRIGANNAVLVQGVTEQLTATGTFSDGTTQSITDNVTWTSSAPAIVSVSNIGLISTLAQGTSTIKATLGTVSGAKKITVTSVSLTSITVNLPPPPFAAGTKQQIQAMGKFSDGSRQSLTSSVTWSSSSPAVASMDNLGRATALKAGSTTITATLLSESGSATLTVKNLTVASVAVQASNTSVPAGITQAFTATGTFTDSTTENFTLSVRWTSSAPTVATVSNAAGKEGLAQGLTLGTANISAVFSSTISGSVTLTVTPAVLVSIAVTPANSTIALGVTEQLAATGTYTDHSMQDITDSVTWSSSMVSVAPVSIGLAEADSVGTTTITASLTLSSGSTISGSTGLTVETAQLMAIIVSPANDFIQVNTKQQYTATGVYTDASTQDLTTTVMWSSSVTTVATINNASGSQGLATALTAGSSTITAAGPGSVTGSTNLTVTSLPPPTITSFTPHSGAIGTPITVKGTNLQPSSGTAAEVTLANQSGGILTAPASSTTATKLTFVIPAGAATGPFTVMLNGGSATSGTPLTVTAATTFTMTAAPAAATLVLPVAGQLPPLPSVSYAITLNSANAFDQLAALTVSGVPGGITATLTPAQITAGQTSILTLNAPAGQPVGQATLSVSAAATISGIAVSASQNLSLTVQAPTTSLIGRTVVSNSQETPIAGVGVTMLGKDGNGNLTGCTGATGSDAAGNFVLRNLSAMCVGSQLVGFNGTTATAPPGQYAGVNLVFTLVSGQATSSPVLVHLPQINGAETFNVQQNASTDQTYSFQSIPRLSVTVYAGTTFTMPDGTTPNPFPLAAVQVPVDRLPDIKPPVPTMITAFIVAFQPANATTCSPSGQCLPVAVYYPNPLNNPPATNMALLTLDPTHGTMVPYGTGTVSSDGTQIVPDMDPAYPGHRFGLIHFDWHMPGYAPPNQLNPCLFCPVSARGQPVDLSSGLAVVNHADISLSGARGTISIIRTYRNAATPNVQNGLLQSGPFGYGTSHNFDYELATASPLNTSVIPLIMPDGNQVPFAKQVDGTFVNSSAVPSMAGAVMTVPDSQHVTLRFKDGTTYGFTVMYANTILRTMLTSITDANGNITQIQRGGGSNADFEVADIIDPVGRDFHFFYNPDGLVTQINAPDYSAVSYSYYIPDSLVPHIGAPPGTAFLASFTDQDGNETFYTYDSAGNLLTETDGRQVRIASNTFDSNNRVSQQVQANGGVLKFSYVLQNMLPPASLSSPVLATTVTDELNNTMTYRFTPAGALIGVTDALGQIRTIARDGYNDIVELTGTGVCPECGNTGAGDQSFTYDSNANLLTQTDSLDDTTTFTYDPVFNKVTSIKDPLGNLTTLTYDSHGNLQTYKDANSNTTAYQYDQFGELVRATDPTNQTTSFAYDSFGNLISIKDALNSITLLEYDKLGRLTRTHDALGRITTIQYDRVGRITSEVNAQNKTTNFAYDQVGNLLSVSDPRGNITSFTYDKMNGLMSHTDPLKRTDMRQYDLNENLTQFQDRRGQTSTFTYDVVNRLIGEVYQDGSSVARSYDAYSRLADVTDSAGGVFAFTYDSAGRLAASATPEGTVQYARDGLGRPTSRQVVGQSAVAYGYDQVGNLLSASTASASVSRTYDPRNLISTASRQNGVNSQYSYDQLGRPLSLTHSGPGGVLASLGYTYDAVGNRATATNSVAQSLITPATSAAAYDTDNEQTQFGTMSNTFDANGNLLSSATAGGITNYSWDSRNRLVSVASSTGATTNFTYDFAGNLIQEQNTGTAATPSQTFVLDDLTNVAYVAQSNGDQYSVLSGQSTDDHMAALHASGLLEYGLTDAINSTVATADQTGKLNGTFFYEPFGQTIATKSNYPFQYTGRVPVSSSLYYYRARFYNTQTGRFISEDPIGFAGDDINLYRYGFNNPVLWTDPSGLEGSLGGDDPGLSDAEIEQLRRQLQDPGLSAREKSQIRRRLAELARRRSKRAHGADKAECSLDLSPQDQQTLIRNLLIGFSGGAGLYLLLFAF